MAQIARAVGSGAIRKTNAKGDSGKVPKRVILYGRVSTSASRGEQDPRVQLDRLRPWVKERGWQIVAEETDHISGDPKRRTGDPPGLRTAMRMLEQRDADVLAVFSCDRLVRSPVHLLQLVGRVQAVGGYVVSMQDGADLDTTTEQGELLLFLRGWFARMELRLTRGRILAGLERARAEGTPLGRPRVDGADPATIRKLRKQGKSWSEIAAALSTVERKVSTGTVRRRAGERDVKAKTSNHRKATR